MKKWDLAKVEKVKVKSFLLCERTEIRTEKTTPSTHAALRLLCIYVPFKVRKANFKVLRNGFQGAKGEFEGRKENSNVRKANFNARKTNSKVRRRNWKVRKR